MKVIDLFCGCGGLSKGFQEAGYELVAAFDNWQPAINNYRKNFPNHPVLNCDLSTPNLDTTVLSNYQAEMIIGGPPCQDFSSAGKRDESLGRADLTYSFTNIIAKVRPNWFVVENVDRAVKSQTFATACRLFKDQGYGLTTKILDASLCGVPQMRKRLFVIGQLNGVENALKPYLEKNLAAQPLTVKAYFGEQLNIEHYYRHPRSYLRRAIFSVNEPSPTIRGVNRPIPATYRLHTGDTCQITPSLRPLTTRERSQVQTFPSSFIFEGTKTDVEQMIGNAVPVKLAQYVANCIKEYCQESISNSNKRNVQTTPQPTQLSFDLSFS